MAKKHLTDEQLMKIIDQCKGHGKMICEKAGINIGTLKRRAFDLSLQSGELIKLTHIDELKKTAEFKKTGIHINGRWLRASGFVEGQAFDLGQKGKKEIILKLVK